MRAEEEDASSPRDKDEGSDQAESYSMRSPHCGTSENKDAVKAGAVLDLLGPDRSAAGRLPRAFSPCFPF